MGNIKPEKQQSQNVIQRLIKEGSLIAYFLLALFLLIALLSYSAEDPGYFTTGSGSIVENSVGTYGAWVSDILLHLFGYLSYCVPALLFYKIYLTFQDLAIEAEFSPAMLSLQISGFLMLMISACGLATIHFEITEDLPYMAGGLVGSLVVDLSLPVLATLGSTLLLLAVFLFGLTVTIKISWLGVIDKIGLWTISFSSWSASRMQKWLEVRKQNSATKERLETRKRGLDIHLKREKKRIPSSVLFRRAGDEDSEGILGNLLHKNQVHKDICRFHGDETRVAEIQPTV